MPSTLTRTPCCVVVLDERRGLLAVDRLALADDVLGVVGAALGLGPLEQPLDDGVLVDLELEDGVERMAVSGQHSSRNRPGPPCAGSRRGGTPGGVVPGEPVLDDLVGDVVGDVAAGRDDVLDLPPSGVVLDVGAEDVAGRDGRDAEPLGDAGGLRALTGAGGAEDDQSLSPEEPFVVTLLQLRLDLLHRLQATPTTMRIEVPPNGKFWLAPTRTRATSGMSETMAR